MPRFSWPKTQVTRRTQLIVGVLLAVLGFAAVTQVRSNSDDSTYTGYRQEDLINVLSGLAASNQRAQTELDRLQQTKTKLESDTQQRQAALNEANTQLMSLQILAGLVPVQGPGIVVTITEDTGTVSVDSFLDLIEELRTAGAEAIAINDKVRVVAQTSFDSGVGGLSVGGQLVTAPFTVSAIGDSATLAGAVTFARGPQSELEGDGASVDVEQDESVSITAVQH